MYYKRKNTKIDVRKVPASLSKIAEKHIDNALKGVNSVAKFILPIAVVFLVSWLGVIEPIFYKTKYHYIRKQKYETQYHNLVSLPSRNERQNYELKKSKDTLKHIDSTFQKGIFQFIDDFVPKPFNSILRFASIENYGAVITAFSAFLLIGFLFLLRKESLRKIAVALRIFKKEGFNEIYDYNIHLPFWVSPIPKGSINGVTREEFIKLWGWNKQEYNHTFCVWLMLGVFTTMQIRLYYILTVTNTNTQWLGWTMTFLLIASLVLCINWILPTLVDDRYNNEDPPELDKRRRFIFAFGVLAAGILLSSSAPTLRKMSIQGMRRPRFVKNKKVRKPKPATAEQRASGLIKSGKLEEAAKIIADQIMLDAKKDYYNIRLYDLQALLILKSPKARSLHNKELYSLAEKSKNDKLQQRLQNWRDKEWKWRKVVALGKPLFWNGLTIK
jgi:hypothetical protein